MESTDYQYQKKSRSYNGFKQTISFIHEKYPNNLVFCDASVVGFDGIAVTKKFKVAVWELSSCQFFVEEVSLTASEIIRGKSFSVDKAEAMAIQKAFSLFPLADKVYSDSNNAVLYCSRFLSLNPVWIPRELNAIADMLTKRNVGNGYLVFNDVSPRRRWLDIVYEDNK